MSQATVVISRRGEGRVLGGHPWVFRSDVADAGGAEPGALVRVAGARRRPLGFAWYSAKSEIRLRMLERGEALPESYLRDRLDAAIRWRDAIAQGEGACRLVHGEGDRLPSLIVDRYGAYLVVQTLSQATERLKPEVVRLLVERLSPKGILERNDPKVRQLEGLSQQVGLLYGEVPPIVEVHEAGVRVEADLWKGQKTGLFLDQRENHATACGYVRGKGRVLDPFAYTGGFALQVARGVESVLAADVSRDAIERLARNAQLNGLTNVTAQEANAFDLLHSLDHRGERFDAVILDPPAFAKSKDAFQKAVRGYKEINLRALRMLNPGGFLVTCSCSYHVLEADFEEILAGAAADAGATVAVVEKRRQGRDHPVVLGVPETYYLKCFVLRRLE